MERISRENDRAGQESKHAPSEFISTQYARGVSCSGLVCFLLYNGFLRTWSFVLFVLIFV